MKCRAVASNRICVSLDLVVFVCCCFFRIKRLIDVWMISLVLQNFKFISQNAKKHMCLSHGSAEILQNKTKQIIRFSHTSWSNSSTAPNPNLKLIQSSFPDTKWPFAFWFLSIHTISVCYFQRFRSFQWPRPLITFVCPSCIHNHSLLLLNNIKLVTYVYVLWFCFSKYLWILCDWKKEKKHTHHWYSTLKTHELHFRYD